jgi:translation initiation factor IF-1
MELSSNDNLRVRRINVEPSARLFRRRRASVSAIRPGDRVMAPLTEFHATMADVTNDEHQNMDGLVESDDFNAEIVVRFLRDNGIDASVDESTSGFRYTAANATRASHVVFACVCLRASISYKIEAAYWCAKAKR